MPAISSFSYEKYYFLSWRGMEFKVVWPMSLADNVVGEFDLRTTHWNEFVLFPVFPPGGNVRTQWKIDSTSGAIIFQQGITRRDVVFTIEPCAGGLQLTPGEASLGPSVFMPRERLFTVRAMEEELAKAALTALFDYYPVPGISEQEF
jgi:hypothetical protein